MDILNIAIFVICSVSLYFVVKSFFSKEERYKKTAQTKQEELRQKYTAQMNHIINKYENDKENQTIYKTKLLKEINQELNVNIFFDKVEVRELLLKLSSM